MLETKKRKRITRDIMIISYIFNISIISTLVALFTSANKSTFKELIVGLVLSVVIISLLVLSKKVIKVRNSIDKLLLHTVAKFYNKVRF